MRRSTLYKVLAVLLVAALIAAVASAASSRPSTTPAEREPAFCRAKDVKAVVDDFIAAFNRGDRRELGFLWVPIRFQWYAVSGAGRGGDLRNHTEYERRSLLRYFAERHERGERLQLARFRYLGFSAAWGHFAFSLRRRAGDIDGGRWASYRGMGAVSCLRGPSGLASWTMALSENR